MKLIKVVPGHGLYIKIFILLFLIFFNLPQPSCRANNLYVDNVSLEDRDPVANTVEVEFDISWDNSWRDDTNHDATWVFVKICEDSCMQDSGPGWEHGELNTSGLNPADTDQGSNDELDIFVPADKVGAFLRRKSAGTGTFSSSNVCLTVDYNSSAGVDDDNIIQIKVFAIEMVYIPEGAFYIGDGDGATESTYAFHDTQDDNNPVQITNSMVTRIGVDAGGDDDSQLENVLGGIGVDGDGGLDRDNDGSVDNYFFPTGYKAFYLMKYELSQGQYRDFLNTLPQNYQNTRVDATLSDEDDANTYVMVVDGQATVDSRQTIKAGEDPLNDYPYTFTCDLDDDDLGDEYDDGEGIAMNHIKWQDVCAYADWAGLRPTTELEYEKVCRGPTSSLMLEYAWGSSTLITQAEGPIQDSGESKEVANTTGDGLSNYDGAGTDTEGPLRVGFSGTGSTSRITAGSGYYGNMQLGGNVDELTVTLGGTYGRRFRGTHGDGTLNVSTDPDYAGNATNRDWPGYYDNEEANNPGVYSVEGSGRRGTNFDVEAKTLSRRTVASSPASSRSAQYGIRCARTEDDAVYSFQSNFVGETSQSDTANPDWDFLAAGPIYLSSDYTRCIIPIAGQTSELITAKEFGFDIPTGATFVAVIVRIHKYSQFEGAYDEEIYLIDAGGDQVGDNIAAAGFWPVTAANIKSTFYGDDESWNVTFTTGMVNSTNFGVRVSCSSIPTNAVYIDQIKMTIIYVEP